MKIESCYYCDDLEKKDMHWHCNKFDIFLCGSGVDPVPVEECDKEGQSCGSCGSWVKNHVGILSCCLKKTNKRFMCDSWSAKK